MGATALSLELEAKSEESDLDEEGWEELFYEVNAIVNLRRPAEAGFLEAIDAGCVVEADCDDFENQRLTFLFNDSWDFGAEAPEHWYALAITACHSQVKRTVGKQGFQLKNPGPGRDCPRDERHRHAAASGHRGRDRGRRQGRRAHGDQGMNLTLSEEDKARVQAVANTRRCECELCQQLRR